MSKSPTIQIIGDTHEPFSHPGYLDFCNDVRKRYRCKEFYHIGDECDNHSLSYHEHSPDLHSPGDEFKRAVTNLKKWYKAYPKMKVCVGNHSALPFRKAHTAGLPKRWLRAYEDVWEAPAGWEWSMEYRVGDNTIITHGTEGGGPTPALSLALRHRMNVIAGHCHTKAGVFYHASRKDLLWGMSVGCGIDRHSLAFAYAKEHTDKPILGCGVVADGVPMFVPMPL